MTSAVSTEGIPIGGFPDWGPLDSVFYLQIKPRVRTLDNVGNVYTPNIDSTDVGIINPVANFTVANPSGTPGDAQNLLLRIKSGASFTPVWGSAYLSSGVAALPVSALPANKTVTYGFKYDAVAVKWILLAADSVGY